jgi:putative ABC transport system ATP-binding protein
MSNTHHLMLKNLNKSFRAGNETLPILQHIDVSINHGETVAIIGPSGSGKSTLLSLLAGLDRPDSGQVVIRQQELGSLSDRELALFRNQHIGIIFQSFELITPFTVLENIHAPLDLAKKKDLEKAQEIAKRVGLEHRLHAYPRTLSGGEKQRVAIARALINDPELILADEPTGSLDQHTSQAVLDLLLEEVRNRSKTLVVITHDRTLADRMDRTLELREGRLHESG